MPDVNELLAFLDSSEDRATFASELANDQAGRHRVVPHHQERTYPAKIHHVRGQLLGIGVCAAASKQIKNTTLLRE